MIQAVSDFGEQFAERVVAKLDDKGAGAATCPICDRREWSVNRETIALLNHMGDEINLRDRVRGMSTIALVCRHCGFVRLHDSLRLFD
jgi:hypothetical protein